MSQSTVVDKGSEEFKSARAHLVDLFFNKSGAADYYNPNPLGSRSKIVDAHLAELPMPFGCTSLLIHPFIDEKTAKVQSIIWFCDRLGCICICCREDFTGEHEKYPDYCPSPGELLDTGEPCDCRGYIRRRCRWEEEEDDDMEDW